MLCAMLLAPMLGRLPDISLFLGAGPGLLLGERALSEWSRFELERCPRRKARWADLLSFWPNDIDVELRNDELGEAFVGEGAGAM